MASWDEAMLELRGEYLREAGERLATLHEQLPPTRQCGDDRRGECTRFHSRIERTTRRQPALQMI